MIRNLMKILFGLAAMLSIAGCACNVQIWGNSDSDNLKIFSQRNPHFVHIGEMTEFKVTVNPDIASYLLVDFCGKLSFAKRTGKGEYSFEKSFDEKWRDRNCNVIVRAFKQNGKRDYRTHRGRVVKSKRYNDPPDELLGEASMRIYCYQSKIILKIKTTDEKEPDWPRGRLVIFGSNKKVTVVKYGRPGVDGFTGFGPELFSGAYIVFYEPKSSHVHRTGKTRVKFSIPDPVTRKIITVEDFIDTP